MQQFRRLRWCVWFRVFLMLHTVKLLKGQLTVNDLQDGDTTKPVAPTTRTQSSASYPMYFSMDQNGSYKYAFDTGSGIASEQSATQANEVTGQYSYYENGVPYMVKYKAGVQGYQAEIIPRENVPMTLATQQSQSSTKNILASNLFGDTDQKFPRPGETVPINADLSQLSPSRNPRIMQPPSNADSAIEATGSLGGADGTVATLQFVQDAMQTMRNGPLQVSFTSQQGFGLPATNLASNGGSFRLLPQSIGPAPVTNAEIQKINSFTENSIASSSATAAYAEIRRQPYEFSYLSPHSSRSESADKSGNVVGKYSYYDDAGFHDITYKAGDGIGFVVLGGSLAERKDDLRNTIVATDQRLSSLSESNAAPSAVQENFPINDSAFLFVNVSQQPKVNYNYRVVADAPSERRTRRNSHSAASAPNTFGGNNKNNNSNRRSLRKFRRNSNW